MISRQVVAVVATGFRHTAIPPDEVNRTRLPRLRLAQSWSKAIQLGLATAPAAAALPNMTSSVSRIFWPMPAGRRNEM